MTMSDMDESLPPKRWSQMTPEEQGAACDQLTDVIMKGVQQLRDDINAELAARGCPLRLCGSLSIRWEKNDEPEGQ